MKQITIIILAITFLSCGNREQVEPSAIKLEEAKAEQFISFTIGERNIILTEFKEDAWPFHGRIVWNDSIEFDTLTEYPISRAIYASVPDDQSPPNHIETFGLEFNQIFSQNEVDVNAKKVISHETFRKEFIQDGEQNLDISTFGFHQTYLFGHATNPSSMRVTKIEHILEHDNMIFVSGEFSGSGDFHSHYGLNPFNLGAISNGKFKVIIEN